MHNNLSQKYLIFICLVVIGAGISALPRNTRAAQKSTGSSDPSQIKSLTIPSNLALSWKGQYTLEDGSSLHRFHPSIKDAIAFSLTGAYTNNIKRGQLFSFSPAAVYTWIVANTKDYNVKPQEPKITIVDDRVTDFLAPQNGQTVDAYASMENALVDLESGNYTTTPVVNITQSRNNLDELNNLGIKELISRGESTFNNSPGNRRHNIAVGVKRMTGVIIHPGEEFSFNKFLGPVEAYAGFLPELVIKGGEGTVPELGGGLCQVSSTTFRAAIHAGLPITQRKNHSYAVSYYAPQGTDATIYPGVIDLKFVNNTLGSIMIWPYFPEQNKLVFDFYGTRDNRQVILKDPIQYDRKSDGSLKASWTQTVIMDGTTDTKTFYSVYQPPALFHKTERFVTAAPAGTVPPVLAPPVTTTPPATPPATKPTQITQ